MSAIYDDYDDYEYFCKVLNIEPVEIRSSKGESFYDHESKLLKELGFKNKYDYYAALRKSKERDEKINDILDEPT